MVPDDTAITNISSLLEQDWSALSKWLNKVLYAIFSVYLDKYS